MITEQQLEQITSFASEREISESLLGQLRSEFPDIHFTYCMDDDVMAAKPVVEKSLFNLYLIDSRNHCLSFTSSPEIATGVVIAELEED